MFAGGILSIAVVISCYPSVAIEPECYMTLPEVARYYGYPSEVHLVTTKDDYILELHRIPHGKDNADEERPVVFFQHGVFSDGFCWGANLPDQSSVFVFADAGFDVWVGNSRGTPPSQKHIGFGPEEKRFWNFTWQDMAAVDLTASINLVLKTTKQFLLNRIPNTPLALPKIIQKFISYFCSLSMAKGVCSLDVGFIDGSEELLNRTRLGLYLCHIPAATSSKNLLHWVQAVKSQKFEKFDYGAKGNVLEYGQITPPTYDLSKIRVPTYLFWSKDDILADTQDIRYTILASMNATVQGNFQLPHYSHIDFIFAANATDDIYRPIIAEIRKDLRLRNNRI
ncbi:unnamed protein product [Nippostrongylus brasiliensis]|uniref:Lipase (inferred by orthology to a C. elegans protein) n=1 Tax=Nippostrongylus brasiliensis TaxID=27835 RepID=A0A0N4YBF0_NIPBR|nr:unnamed protein product [Nippostrongylus brasiliensis]